MSAFYRTMEMVSREEAMTAITQPSSDPASRSLDRSLVYLYCRQQGLWLKEVAEHELPADALWFERYCPVRNIDSKLPPTALVHGIQDDDVPHEESEKLVRSLAANGIVHQFVSLPGVGHGFAGAEADIVQAAEATVANFLSEQLGHGAGEAEPAELKCQVAQEPPSRI